MFKYILLQRFNLLKRETDKKYIQCMLLTIISSFTQKSDTDQEEKSILMLILLILVNIDRQLIIRMKLFHFIIINNSAN